MKVKLLSFLLFNVLVSTFSSYAQESNTSWEKIRLKKNKFELHNVTGSIVKFQGSKVLKIERDLNAIPFDESRIEETVDEPHYARLLGLEDFENGEIEVKVYSQLQDPKPYNGIAGFIGVYFRIHPEDNAFDGIYLRPKAGSSKDQWVRNHTVQYIAYPDAKFDMLRKRAPFKYEGAAPVVLNEWITMRIVVNGNQAELFINSIKHAIFSVDQLLSTNQKGGVGLYIDIGTVGYFKDLKVIKKPYVPVNTKGNEVKGI